MSISDGKVKLRMPWQNIPDLAPGTEVWIARDYKNDDLEFSKARVLRTTNTFVFLEESETLIRRIGRTQFYRNSGNQVKGSLYYWWIAGRQAWTSPRSVSSVGRVLPWYGRGLQFDPGFWLHRFLDSFVVLQM